MNIIFYIIILLIFFTTFILIHSYTKNEITSIVITMLCSLIIFSLIVNPSNCINNSINGAKLFAYKVFPTMFPFTMLLNIIISYDGIYIYSKVFGKLLCKPLRLPSNCSIVLIISFLCGYPMGAQYCCELLEKKDIDFNTASRLINIATNCSPLFLVGTIGESMMGSSQYGYILLISSYISCLIMGLIIPGNTVIKNTKTINKHILKNENIGKVLKNSVENSIASSLLVLGFIIIFSVFLGIIKTTVIFSIVNHSTVLGSLLLGSIEMTNGSNLVSISSLNTEVKLILFSFFTSFGGLCVIAQTYAYTSKYKFSLIKYIYRKIFQGIIASCATLILFRISNYGIFTINQEIYNTFTNSNTLILLLVLISILPFIIYKGIQFIESF